jgi:hypothetical protein
MDSNEKISNLHINTTECSFWLIFTVASDFQRNYLFEDYFVQNISYLNLVETKRNLLD